MSQSSRRLTPSQEEIVISREQEDGEAEQDYIRAMPEGDIYVNSGITGHYLPVYVKVDTYVYLFFYDLEIRTENRESEASEENVVRIPINYSEHKTNASSFGRTMETSSNQSQGSGITVSENVSRDFHDYENWTPRVLPTSPPDKPKEVRFKLPRGKE